MGSRLACAGFVVALIAARALAQDDAPPLDEQGGAVPTEEAAPPVLHSAPPAEAPPPHAAPNRVPVPAPPSPGAPSPAVTAGPEPKVLGRRFPSPLQVQPERAPPDVSVSIVSPGESGVHRKVGPGRTGGAESLTDEGMGEGNPETQVERLE